MLGRTSDSLVPGLGRLGIELCGSVFSGGGVRFGGAGLLDDVESTCLFCGDCRCDGIVGGGAGGGVLIGSLVVDIGERVDIGVSGCSSVVDMSSSLLSYSTRSGLSSKSTCFGACGGG